ncbi:MAG: hypothetical protein ABJF01_18795 [bacterium]
MRARALGAALLAPFVLVSPGRAQTPPPPGAVVPVIGPPIRKIATASAISTELLGGINTVVELRDGRVLVNDGVRRRLLAMDTTLTKVDIILDSLAEVANTYGTRSGTLIPYRGDSLLFVDPVSYAMVVLDPTAQIVRVRSVWRVQDTYLFSAPTGYYGWPGADAKGRIVYRVPAMPAPPKVAPPAGVPYFPPEPDSAFIVGIDLDTRKLDTLGAVRIPKSLNTIKQSVEGYFTFTTTLNPLPTTDEWAVMSNGDVAFVRGRDYRVEYLHGDGTMTSTQRLPFEWQRLSDDDKQKLVDSVKNVNQRQYTVSYIGAMIRWANMYKRPYPPSLKIPDGYVPTPGLMKAWRLPPGLTLPPTYIYGCPPGVEPTMTPPAAGAAAAPIPMPMPMPTPMPGSPGALSGTPSCIPQPIVVGGGNVPPPPTLREVSVLPASELPDYRPPLPGAATRADADGNLWIRTIPPKPIPGGTVYDIINAQGELADRLQLPPGYALVGFGKGKVVYLSTRDAKGFHLARVRLK